MLISTQHVLKNKRAPRVNITYDLEIGGAFIVKELPYVFGVLSDLSGESKKQPLKSRKFVEINGGNFNEVMEAIGPSLNFSVNNKFSTTMLNLSLSFSSIEDFSPLSIIEQTSVLKDASNMVASLNDFLAKVETREGLLNLFANLVSNKSTFSTLTKDIKNGLKAKVNSKDTLGSVLNSAGFATSDRIKTTAFIKLLVSVLPVLLENLADGEKSVVPLVKRTIAKLNKNIGLQLDEILHNEKLLKLEGSWRGLQYLLSSSNIGSNIIIRVFNASKDELLKDFRNSIEFDLSVLFKKVYEAEYGTFGGNPYSCLVLDYYFGRNNQDTELLTHISKVSCAAHVPTLGGVDPEMFDMESFATINEPRDLAQLFESSELGAWKGLRETEESRYISLTLPRILIRLPYDAEKNPVKGLEYSETMTGIDNSAFCWTNASFALAQRIVSAATIYNWTTAIRGVGGGGVVRELTLYSHKTPEGDIVVKCPTESAINDRREQELSKLGFVPLCHCRGTNYAVFFGAQTAHKPQKYSSDDASANSELSARLNYMLAASRFAHYLKAMMRDRIGSAISRDDIELQLNNWLARYILLSDSANQDLKARFPLREGRVNVTEDESNPGGYEATVYLRPHFQLEELDVSIRLVAKLPAPSR